MLAFESLSEMSEMLERAESASMVAEISDRFKDCERVLHNFRQRLTTSTLHLDSELERLEIMCHKESRRAADYLAEFEE